MMSMWRAWSRLRKFHTLRLAIWTVQIPFAILISALQESLKYLIFLSLAALVESALTDVITAVMAEREALGKPPIDPADVGE